jgi:hypothetical protein
LLLLLLLLLWVVVVFAGGCVSELQADGVDPSLLLRAAGQPSPFTYIIVDREGEG